MVTEQQGALLLVEDEHRLRGLVAQFLRGEGFAVVEAADGPQGVQRFADSGPFDLVLVDLNLPTFSGVEVCRRIKRDHPGQPILVCSAAVVRENEEALAGVGVTHFLSKPYHPEALLNRIRQQVGGRPGVPAPHFFEAGRGCVSGDPAVGRC